MKTSDLIRVLTAGAAPVKRASAGRLLVFGAAAGVLAALALLALWLGLQPLAPAMHERWFWMKAGYGAALAVAGGLLLLRLARPGARLGWAAVAIGGVAAAVMCGMSVMDMARASPAHRLDLWLGSSWDLCPLRITALSAPVFVGLLLALRRLAPTRLVLTGAAAGLTAGALAACVYGLYCEETAAPFVATWYTLGIGTCALLGALVGRRALRW